MNINLARWFLIFCVFVAMPVPAAAPLTRAHAHNDYEHQRPLLDALGHGFWSVEADIWLTNGQLLVAHDFAKASADRTLAKLYLDPLSQFVATNQENVRQFGPLTLLIDVKSDATNTWLVLREVLARYTNILTAFEGNAIRSNAVTVILSGNRATALLGAEPIRYAAIDGRLPDLSANPPAALMPLVSDNWTKSFKWRGVGAFPSAEREDLKALVAQAHAQGRRIRLWAAPDNVAGWRVLLDAGVDLINTDRLGELEGFLRER